MTNDNLFIYKLMNNPNARVQILGLSKDIVSYTTQDFSFSLSAQWSGRNPSSGFNLANTLERGGKELYNRTLGRKFGSLTTAMTLDLAGSMLDYQGTDLLGFTINMYFVATRSTDDVRTKIGYLAEGLCPDFEPKQGLTRIYAPNSFKMGDVNDVQGAMSIRIGQWFRSPKLFVIENMDFVLSKTTLPNGLPLYASGSVLFKSVRILSIREVKGMFGLS